MGNDFFVSPAVLPPPPSGVPDDPRFGDAPPADGTYKPVYGPDGSASFNWGAVLDDLSRVAVAYAPAKRGDVGQPQVQKVQTAPDAANNRNAKASAAWPWWVWLLIALLVLALLVVLVRALS